MIVDPELVRRYTAVGWWEERSLGEMVRAHEPGRTAYIEPSRTLTWGDLDRAADKVAGALAEAGMSPGDRVALLLPDGADFHVALLGTERAGVVAVGIGARAGDAEIAHLVRHSGARGIVTLLEHRGRDMTELPAALTGHGAEVERHIVLFEGGGAAPQARLGAKARLGPNDLWMLNSTSGTTGLPKCVMQHQNRWIAFAKLAIEAAGGMREDEVLLGAVPAPFGFGLWSAHVLPILTGMTAAVLPRFDVDELAMMIERERPAVLCLVSTQLRMLMRKRPDTDLSSVRVVFTGGEAIPYEDAAAFEERSGAAVLNFFGSNESGAFSRTTVHDPRETRLRTGGRLIPEMDVRIFDEHGRTMLSSGPGRPGGKGPLLSAGYYRDEEANRELFTDDGYLLMGDLVSLDKDGYLHVVGRTSDIIIRGGKNISAREVEDAVGGHPAVELCGVVPVPDELFGERVCAVVSLRPGASLTLAGLATHLVGEGLTKELLPEHLVVLPDLPRSSGDKVAKGELRRIAAEQVERAKPGSDKETTSFA